MYRFNHPSAPNTRPEQEPEQLNRSTTPGGMSWKKALAISAAPLALLFGAAFQSPNSVPGQLQAIQSQLNALHAKVDSLASKGPRKFYVTKTFHKGDEALSACDSGYHMASLREIHDTSNLRYDTELGFTRVDSGFGPPGGFGWMRTGESGSDFSSAGIGNCLAWTSADVGDSGTIVSTSASWGGLGTVVSPWSSGTTSCNSSLIRVWCVQD